MNDVVSTSTTTSITKRSLVPTTLANTVRVASFKERVAIGNTLAYAFAEDQLSFFILDGDGDELSHYSDECRWDVHRTVMRYMSALHIVGGTVTVAGPDYDAVALWYVWHIDTVNAVVNSPQG